jgi:hypothetical protein
MAVVPLIATRFLGVGIGGGVAPVLRDALGRVEDALRDEYARAQLTAPDGLTWGPWHGVHAIGGYRERGGHHSEGIAIDLDYARNGYSPTRTGSTLGGEAAGAKLPGVRAAFMAAADRACLAAYGRPADLSARGKGESTGAVWDRWKRVSDAVVAYLSPWYVSDAGQPGPLVGRVVPPQVALDYVALRTPLVIGAPSLAPKIARNPARGLMSLRRPVVVALCDVGGLRWGACDFGRLESGDIMHFDLARRIA